MGFNSAFKGLTIQFVYLQSDLCICGCLFTKLSIPLLTVCTPVHCTVAVSTVTSPNFTHLHYVKFMTVTEVTTDIRSDRLAGVLQKHLTLRPCRQNYASVKCMSSIFQTSLYDSSHWSPYCVANNQLGREILVNYVIQTFIALRGLRLSQQ